MLAGLNSEDDTANYSTSIARQWPSLPPVSQDCSLERSTVLGSGLWTDPEHMDLGMRSWSLFQPKATVSLGI
jgi:hypothetical protein